MRGYFVNLHEKIGGEILKSPPVHYDSVRLIEYLDKIKFYVYQMLPLLKGEAECENYPRRTLYAFNCPCGMCDYEGLCHRNDITGLTLRESKRTSEAIFLSPTQLLRYETCPRQWAYYAMGYETTISAAKLHFGSSVHSAIEAYIRLGKEPKEAFSFFWGEYKDAPLKYTEKTNHEYFQKVGDSLMEKFPAFYDQEIITGLNVSETQVEESNTKRLHEYIGYPVYFTGKPDLVCKTHDGDTMIIDWKVTSKKTFSESWLSVSDQMTGYFLFLSS